MKASILIFMILTFFAVVNCFAAEEITVSEPPAQASAQSAAVAAAEPAAGSGLFLTYNYYRYDMTGQSTANTNIYKFGESTVDLHLVTTTWVYNANWTFLAIVPYMKSTVETIYVPSANGGTKLTDETSGVGDLRLMAVTSVSLNPDYATMLDISVTAPTGSINENFSSTPSQRASYNMQLGSGTPDLIVGATVTNKTNQFVSTARGQATVRGGKNKNGYALGNEFLTGLTSMYHFNSYVSLGASANYKIRGAVVGRDDKYELFNNFQAGNIAGDGHQYYHGPQANYDANIVGKFQTPAFASMVAALEIGVPVVQGAQNKDDIRLDLNYYAAGTLNASF